MSFTKAMQRHEAREAAKKAAHEAATKKIAEETAKKAIAQIKAEEKARKQAEAEKTAEKFKATKKQAEITKEILKTEKKLAAADKNIKDQKATITTMEAEIKTLTDSIPGLRKDQTDKQDAHEKAVSERTAAHVELQSATDKATEAGRILKQKEKALNSAQKAYDMEKAALESAVKGTGSGIDSYKAGSLTHLEKVTADNTYHTKQNALNSARAEVEKAQEVFEQLNEKAGTLARTMLEKEAAEKKAASEVANALKATVEAEEVISTKGKTLETEKAALKTLETADKAIEADLKVALHDFAEEVIATKNLLDQPITTEPEAEAYFLNVVNDMVNGSLSSHADTSLQELTQDTHFWDVFKGVWDGMDSSSEGQDGGASA